jgi:bacterial/archaeal transporter family-2 protein
MGRTLAVVLTAAAGTLIALQAPVNSRLGKELGTLQAASVSFAVGLVVLVAVTLAFGGGLGDLGDVANVPVVYLIGGLLGAVYVTCVLITVRDLGAGGVTAATIAGQLGMAVVIDHFGWLGVTRQPVTVARVAGIVLLAAGVFLVVRN